MIAAMNTPVETPIKRIPLTGLAGEPDAELSSMAWYGDTLLLLPQYPDRFAVEHSAEASDDGVVGALLTIPRAQLQAVIDGVSDESITPDRCELIAPGLSEAVPGMQGFEAIAVSGTRIFATIEAELAHGMTGWLLAGTISEDGGRVSLDTRNMVEIRPTAPVFNASEESLVIVGDRVISIFEANGKNVNPEPRAHIFDLDLRPHGTIPFPTIEYRIIDATTADDNGQFWVSNYFFPGDRDIYRPAADAIAEKYGLGPSHQQSNIVERLLLLGYDPEDGIQLIDRPPVQLQLGESGRNWEGLVRFGDQGFLVATDKFPETIFGFIAMP